MLHRYLHFYFLFKNKVMDPKLLKKGRILGCRIHQDGQNLAELRRRLPRGNCRCRMTQVFILNHRKCQLYSFLVSDKKNWFVFKLSQNSSFLLFPPFYGYNIITSNLGNYRVFCVGSFLLHD